MTGVSCCVRFGNVLESLDLPSMAAFERVYSEGIDDGLARRNLAREAAWTEALAIGDAAFQFVEAALPMVGI